MMKQVLKTVNSETDCLSSRQKNKINVIVKPTHDCNLGCEYCYVGDEAEKGRMDERTLFNTVDKTLEIYDYVGFIWHGGEPLLMGLDFYKKAVEFQKQHEGKAWTNGFQSNGTLIDDKVIDFCKNFDFHLGLSLDGPQEINDITRHYKDGDSAFNKIITASRKARKAKVGGGVVAVINKHNVNRLEEIYNWAKEENIGLKLNPLIKSGKAYNSYPDLGIGPAEYGKSLVKLFDRWFFDNWSEKRPISLDPFEEIMGNLLTGKTFGCNYSVSCQESFISIGPQGDIYPCGRFDGIPEFHLGNINTGSLTEILNLDIVQHLKERTNRIKDCDPCDYKKICNGGCMHNAYMVDENIDHKDFYCASYKLLFKHIQERVENELLKVEVKENVA